MSEPHRRQQARVGGPRVGAGRLSSDDRTGADIVSEMLEELAEGPRYAAGILESHKPVHPGPGRTRCPVCDAWYPCDLVSLAALATLMHRERDAAIERADSAEARLAEALAALDAADALFDEAGAALSLLEGHGEWADMCAAISAYEEARAGIAGQPARQEGE